MRLLESDYFTYRDDKLFCEDISIDELSSFTETPVYIYSRQFFTDRFNEYSSAFKGIPHTIFYASKANSNLNVIKIFYELGAGIDVNSAGEFYRAERAGVPPGKMLLSGVGKTKSEIKLAVEKDIFQIKAESFGEIELINKIAGEAGKSASIAIRVNPDVDPQTHPYISTGLSENKFGMAEKDVLEMLAEIKKMTNLRLTGLDMHIGSQITSISPFVDAVGKMAELFSEIRSRGFNLEHLDLGGGMGINYFDEEPFTPAEFASRIIPIVTPLDCKLFLEPGRSLTANGGVLIAEVLYTKKNKQKNFVVVDTAMTELLRPSIYKAYHHIEPVTLNKREDIRADVVGPVCESGDFLAKDRLISDMIPGEKLAVMSAGAYGMVMSSNYNGRRRAPEVIVDGCKFHLCRSRETYDHLLFDESVVDELFNK